MLDCTCFESSAFVVFVVFEALRSRCAKPCQLQRWKGLQGVAQDCLRYFEDERNATRTLSGYMTHQRAWKTQSTRVLARWSCSKELTSWLHLYVTKDLELELEIYRSWWVGPPQARSCWFRWRLSIALTLFLGTPLSQACISRSPICAHLVSTTFKFQLRLEQRELTIEQRMDGVKTSRK